jgi:DHA2 family multidrug resistance protein
MPLIVRSFGTVFMFLPLQLASLGPVPKKDVAAATGLFNLTRQLGGSMGIALLTMLLDRRTAFHYAALSEHLVANDPSALTRVALMSHALAGKGMATGAAHAAALKMMDGSVRLQAMIIAFGDTFWATGALVVCGLPLVLLLGKPEKGAAPITAGGH